MSATNPRLPPKAPALVLGIGLAAFVLTTVLFLPIFQLGEGLSGIFGQGYPDPSVAALGTATLMAVLLGSVFGVLFARVETVLIGVDTADLTPVLTSLGYTRFEDRASTWRPRSGPDRSDLVLRAEETGTRIVASRLAAWRLRRAHAQMLAR